MSYVVNQYNYATPLSSVAGLTNETSVVPDIKYFTLSDNTLDGSYYPVVGDVGIWGAALPDSEGYLEEPFTITVEGPFTIHALSFTFSSYCYANDYTVEIYNGDERLVALSVEGLTSPTNTVYLSEKYEATHYVLQVTRVSNSSSPIKLYNTYYPAYLKRSDILNAQATEVAVTNDGRFLLRTDLLVVTNEEETKSTFTAFSADNLKVKQTNANTHIRNTISKSDDTLKAFVKNERSHILNTIDVTTDTLLAKTQSVATPLNIHTVMKQPFRRIYGKVYVTYTDPMLDNETSVEASHSAYNSNKEQILDGLADVDNKFFNLYENDLTGSYVVSDADSQVGWVSSVISNSKGYFDEDPSFYISFSARPVVALEISFDPNNIVKDFTIDFTDETGKEYSYYFYDNADKVVSVQDSVADIVKITLTIHRVTKPFYPAVVLDMPISSTLLYRGYSDVSDLISIDLLEELTYEDEIEALGGISANEISITFDNSNKDFFFNSDSMVSKQLRRNRKIVPWLGTEIVPGTIEWYTLGTFWSYRWNVPVEGITASVVGFDTLGLLDSTDFTNHHTQIDKSIGQLIEYVLEDARKTLHFIEYIIDETLYDIIIPYAWFDRASYTAALRKLSLCYPLHIYCDRQGRICAAPQKLHLDYYYDTWSDDTNVLEKSYSSLYTALPNIINVQVVRPIIVPDENLVNDETVFNVYESDSRTLNFSSPYLSDINVEIDCDDTLSYTYEVYSWGIEIMFTGTGTVRSISCNGSCVDTSTVSVLTERNERAIRLDGAITRNVESDFIQTSELASLIIYRSFNLSEHDKFDASVKYRGDIALSINDPIRLMNGIAPDNRYNIKRHELSWSGYLTGSAELNT